ncbi:hypothetical protein [Streptomyces sp. SID3343]|uniref:hypothetical protein n=1 Tax=Streptomyces sp. SID3343 TaxID=2690260 RepID=UPI001368E772|nr:hypothetical protein [Streptomyces sp. SID3343]MYV98886.1 hypothetical protein [Streptomyces sp. SID3343]
MASSNAGDKLYPYENDNWAMLIQADPDHPLEPGTEDGGLVILIQNIGSTPRKLNSYIGLPYRTSNTPGQIVFTTPWEKADELNMDTAVGGTFAPDGLPGDKVFLTITPPVAEGSPVEAPITSIEQDRKVWGFLPKADWQEGTEYTVLAWSELEGIPSAPTSRTFKAVAPKPSVNILTPAKDGVALSPRTRPTGSYGGIVKKTDGVTRPTHGQQDPYRKPQRRKRRSGATASPCTSFRSPASGQGHRPRLGGLTAAGALGHSESEPSAVVRCGRPAWHRVMPYDDEPASTGRYAAPAA